MLKRFTILAISLFTNVLAFTQHEKGNINNNVHNTARWIVLRGSSLRVDGSTNINKFSCEIEDYNNPDTISIFKNNIKEQVFAMKGNLSLDVMGFNCHNPMMTSDLRKTLKSKEFPRLSIRFISLSKLPDIRNPQEQITGWVDIEIAGVIKRFDVNYRFTIDQQRNIHLIGTRAVNFSDFNLIPPRKLGGMIKANERLDVEFHLVLKTIG
ncbi:MAG: YceI family protein [Bacteroidota bacterium]|nr:YceI family protein [Bacteroidota bacterium]